MRIHESMASTKPPAFQPPKSATGHENKSASGSPMVKPIIVDTTVRPIARRGS